MKRAAKLAFFVVALLAARVLFAQSTQPIKFTAPFPFTIGDQVLPAGDYTVSVPASTGVLTLISSNGKHSAFVNAVSLEKLDPETKFRLVFHRYGDQYYVSEIWAPGFRTGRFVIPSGTEKEKPDAPQHVVVYAQLRDK